MHIRAGFEISFDCAAPVPGVLCLSIHPERRSDLITSDRIESDSSARLAHYTDTFGNLCTRALFTPGTTTLTANFVIRDSGMPDRVLPDAPLTPLQDIPNDAMIYLLGSRYCETDRMCELAWKLFAHTPPTWARVQAIVDFVHERIEFGYQHARSTRTSQEAYEERRGVCRDFAHLAVTLCRSMNIPARYCTGYLGDIGVPPVDTPMDFSAWFEVFVDGAWHTLDARHNTPRIGRLLVARGRDAADTAISTTFGEATLKRFTIITDEVITTNAEAA